MQVQPCCCGMEYGVLVIFCGFWLLRRCLSYLGDINESFTCYVILSYFTCDEQPCECVTYCILPLFLCCLLLRKRIELFLREWLIFAESELRFLGISDRATTQKQAANVWDVVHILWCLERFSVLWIVDFQCKLWIANIWSAHYYHLWHFLQIW